MNNIIDFEGYVPTEYVAVLTILKALDHGFEFDAYEDMQTFTDVYLDAHTFLINNFKPERFEICHDVSADYVSKTATYKYKDGYGTEMIGDCSKEFFGETRAIERDVLEWEYIDSSDIYFDSAHRLVNRIIDSLGNMVQLIY